MTFASAIYEVAGKSVADGHRTACRTTKLYKLSKTLRHILRRIYEKLKIYLQQTLKNLKMFQKLGH